MLQLSQPLRIREFRRPEPVRPGDLSGRYLAPPGELDPPLPHGLGTRHEAAAGITAMSQAVALCISQSTGTVSIFKGGRLVTDIPKPWGRTADSL